MTHPSTAIMDAQKAAFLEALAHTGIIGTAAAAAGVDRITTWRWRKDPAFAERVDAALEEAADRIEAEAHRRAVQGIDVPVINKGAPTYQFEVDAHGYPLVNPETGLPVLKLDSEGRPVMLTTKSYSDGLLVKLLGAFKPERYRDNARLELTGADGGPVVMDDAQRAAKLASLIALAEARKQQARAGTETGLGDDDGGDLV